MLQEGQKLYLKYSVYSNRSKLPPREVTIEKVGRKWAYLLDTDYRIDINTLRIDGGNYLSPGRCYLTLAHYENEVLQYRIWNIFRNTIHNRINPPKNLTPERMKSILQEMFSGETFNFEVQ